MDLATVVGLFTFPQNAPPQVQVALSEKEDYDKGALMYIDDDNDTQHEQAFNKGACVTDANGTQYWVFFTKDGEVTVVDGNLKQHTFFPSDVQEVEIE